MPNYLIALIPIALIALWVGLAVVDAMKAGAPRNLRQQRDKLPGAATWTVLLFALICGGLALFFGWLGYSEATKEEFYVNLATSLGSIAITVLVIDQLNRWRIASERKREIIEQMGSPVHDAAREAVRLARTNGWLEDGSLKGAYLWYANLQNADLEDADLQGARLWCADLQGARLWGANLQGAYLRYANLQSASLAGADLHDARLNAANLQGAYLWHANLQNADLEDADLQGARLEGASFQGTYLGEANLRGATYDSKTIWPKGFDPVAASARLVDADPT